jgi:hypothetical protein
LRLDFSLSRITSATSDVLANFSRLSIFIPFVNLFLVLLIFFQITKTPKPTVNSNSAKYQNIVTPEKNERGALSSWKISNQLQWLGFGLSVDPIQDLNRDQTLGLRSVIPLLSAPMLPRLR